MPDEKNEKLSGDVTLRSPLLGKLENFWYHHKWPFLASLLALVVLTVTLVQCANKGKGDDAYVMYAGGYTLMSEERGAFEQTIAGFVGDRNGDGKTIVGIGNYAIYTPDEIKVKFDRDNQGYVQNLSGQNREAFDQEIMAGEASLCFLSPALFEVLAGNKSGSLLRPVSDYAESLPAGAEPVLYGEVVYGVRLSSLALAGYPGMGGLPEDTILCLRTETSMNSLLGGSQAKEIYAANLSLLRQLLAAEPYASK